jgi:hypothetical protein
VLVRGSMGVKGHFIICPVVMLSGQGSPSVAGVELSLSVWCLVAGQ